MSPIILLLATIVVPGGRSFACTPVRVWDGDGPLWCSEGPRVRLAGIAARESDGSCRPNQPCSDASAEAARRALVSLVGRRIGSSRQGHVLVIGPTLTCSSSGSAGGSRTAAWCTSPMAGDLSCAMLATRMVLVWPRYWRGHVCSRTDRPAQASVPLRRRRQPASSGS